MTPLPRHLLSSLLAPALAAALALAPVSGRAQTPPDPSDWDGVLEAARGQTVYFHAWGGEPRINDFIAWAGEELQRRHGVTVEQVKVDDTANVVSRIVAEKAAGKTEGGAVDLVWINGENFVALKNAGLLMSPGWATKASELAACGHSRQAGGADRLHRTDRRAGKPLGNGKARLHA